MIERAFTLPDTLPVVYCTRDDSPITKDFVLPGLPAGKVGILSAPGGTGKSFLLLELIMSVATRVPLIAGILPPVAGPARYISFEEDADDLHNRILSILKDFPSARMSENVLVSSLEGQNLPLLIGSELFPPAIEWLQKQCENTRLLVLDPFSKLHESEENSNAEMKKVIQVIINIAKKTKCAILIAHHTNKLATLSGKGEVQQSARGASALVDDVRLCMTLSKPQDSNPYTVLLSWAKMNGCAPITPMVLIRLKSGVLERDVSNLRAEDLS